MPDIFFTSEELLVIFRALKMNYLDGPDNYFHAVQLERLMNNLVPKIEHLPGFAPFRQGL